MDQDRRKHLHFANLAGFEGTDKSNKTGRKQAVNNGGRKPSHKQPKNDRTMKATAKNIKAIANEVNNVKARSAWSKGVKAYALGILANFEEWRMWNEKNGKSVPELDERTALNGADNWRHWAESASGLAASYAILCRLCPPSEIKKGVRGIDWLEVEARAARQAWQMIAEAVRVVEYKQVKAEAVKGLQKLHGISEAEAVEQFGYIVEA